MSKSLLQSLFVLLLGIPTVAHSEGATLLKRTLVGGHPESVFMWGHDIYASNMGEHPGVRKDGDGYISHLDFAGNLLAKNKYPSVLLNSPTGMAVSSYVLYVADVDRVVGIDIFSGLQVRVFDFSTLGAKFLNDIQSIGGHQLAVTETNLKKVFIIDLTSGMIEPMIIDPGLLKSPNGLAFDHYTRFLYLAQNDVHALGENNGQVLKLHLTNSGQPDSQMASPHFGKFIDGIAELSNGELIVSDWVGFGASGTMWNMTKTLGATPGDTLDVKGFADFSFAEDPGVLAAPHLITGEVSLFRIPSPSDSPTFGENYIFCRAKSRLESCSTQCEDQFCQRECQKAADFTCSEFSFRNQACNAGCEDQFCHRRCFLAVRNQVCMDRCINGSPFSENNRADCQQICPPG